MNYAQAQNLLDMRREGQHMTQVLVDQALELTGDLRQDQITELIEELEKDSDK